jgi:hypothetical protein
MPKYTVGGWLPDPVDHRDIPAAFTPAPAHITQVDLRKQCPPVMNQGSHGTCVAHGGMVGFLGALFTLGYPQTMLSRAYSYWRAREAAGLDPSADDGTFIRSWIKAMVKHGAPPESEWTYDDAHLCHKPTTAATQSALRWQLLPGYHSVQLTPDGIRAALAAGHPVVFGMDVYSNFMDVDASGVIPLPRGANEGGHCMAIVGFFDEATAEAPAQTLLLQNSWGTNWGRQGHGYLPYEALTACRASDGWTIVNVEHGA